MVSVILIGIEMNYVESWVQLACYTVLAAFAFSLVGGWFGSQLFPPIHPRRRERGLGDSAI
jgi:hypothetical protein